MNSFMSWFSKLFISPVISALFIKEIRGRENIPAHNFILASNHQSHLDLVVNGSLCVPRKFRFIGQVDQYTGFEGFLRDVIYFLSGTIPMDRKNRESKDRALAVASDTLKKGESIIVFPEGTRSRTGQMGKGKKGVAWLMMSSRIPVLPVAISGAFELMPPGGKIQIKKNIRINIGKTLYFPDLVEKASKAEVFSEEYLGTLQEITDKIMAEIAKLKSEIEG
ncbi:MAG TPA: lysophospholipid acyltransferase family protein [Candidatus Pacearchaeota archaeon]|nr:lysophospholipid acyltransferase family protein [Candidatus Pacearchaeota archaeon]